MTHSKNSATQASTMNGATSLGSQILGEQMSPLQQYMVSEIDRMKRAQDDARAAYARELGKLEGLIEQRLRDLEAQTEINAASIEDARQNANTLRSTCARLGDHANRNETDISTLREEWRQDSEQTRERLDGLGRMDEQLQASITTLKSRVNTLNDRCHDFDTRLRSAADPSTTPNAEAIQAMSSRFDRIERSIVDINNALAASADRLGDDTGSTRDVRST